jgi:hypothetical protein
MGRGEVSFFAAYRGCLYVPNSARGSAAVGIWEVFELCNHGYKCRIGPQEPHRAPFPLLLGADRQVAQRAQPGASMPAMKTGNAAARYSATAPVPPKASHNRLVMRHAGSETDALARRLLSRSIPLVLHKSSRCAEAQKRHAAKRKLRVEPQQSHAVPAMGGAAPPPDVLYHYTTAPGLLSMIKSGHLWATELRYMNDPREFLKGAEVILGVIDRLAKGKNPPRAFRCLRKKVHRHIDEKLLNMRIFCVSFCTTGDLLSQWRGYGDAGGGYAVGFEPSFLFGQLQTEGPPLRLLRRVIYNREHQERIVAGWGHAVLGGAVSDNDWLFWRFFSQALASFKNSAYEEEGEWRLVQFGRVWSGREAPWLYPVQFRERRGEIVPYAIIDLSQSEPYPGRPPISKIVYGPTLHPERTEKALRLLTEDSGYAKGQVGLKRSIVPFNKP